MKIEAQVEGIAIVVVVVVAVEAIIVVLVIVAIIVVVKDAMDRLLSILPYSRTFSIGNVLVRQPVTHWRYV